MSPLSPRLDGVPVLVVSPVAFEPDWEGNRKRVKQMVALFQGAGAEVHFLHIAHTDGDTVAMSAALEGRFSSVADTRRESWLVPWYVRMRAARFLRQPWLHSFSTDAWYGPAIEAAVQRLVERHRIEVVVCEYVFYSRFLGRLPGVVRIIDTHDVFADRWRVLQSLGRAPDWYSTSRAGEARALARADFVLAIQEQDASHFRSYGHTGVMTLEYLPPVAGDHSPPARQSSHGARTESSLRLCFVGSANDVNVAAVRQYLDEVHPRLLAAALPFETWIAGDVCRRFSGQDLAAVRWLGRLDDLGDLWRASDALVNVVEAGTGLPIKVVEALDNGLHVLGSPSGTRGLPVPLACVQTIDDPSKWVSAVAALLQRRREGEDLRALAQADARRFRSHVETNAGRVLNAVWERLASSHQRLNRTSK